MPQKKRPVVGGPTEAHPRRHEKGVTRAMIDMGIRDQAGYHTRQVNVVGGPGAGCHGRGRHEVDATKGGHAGLLGRPLRGRGNVRSPRGSAGQVPGGRDTAGQRGAFCTTGGRQGRQGQGTTAAAAAAELRQRPSFRGRQRPNGGQPRAARRGRECRGGGAAGQRPGEVGRLAPGKGRRAGRSVRSRDTAGQRQAACTQGG